MSKTINQDGYMVIYEDLTKSLKKDDEVTYRKKLLRLKLSQLQKGLKVARVYQAGDNGTTVKFKAIVSKRTLNDYMDRLNDEATELGIILNRIFGGDEYVPQDKYSK